MFRKRIILPSSGNITVDSVSGYHENGGKTFFHKVCKHLNYSDVIRTTTKWQVTKNYKRVILSNSVGTLRFLYDFP